MKKNEQILVSKALPAYNAFQKEQKENLLQWKLNLKKKCKSS